MRERQREGRRGTREVREEEGQDGLTEATGVREGKGMRNSGLERERKRGNGSMSGILYTRDS